LGVFCYTFGLAHFLRYFDTYDNTHRQRHSVMPSKSNASNRFTCQHIAILKSLFF
jgi:hypothetical protein